MRKPIVSVSTLALGLLLGLGLGLGATSCTSTRKHCFYAEGDATCTAEFGEGYFCVAESCEAQNLGCVSVKPSPECAAPYGMDGTTDEMADGMTDPTTSESSTEATTEPDTTATEATDVETTASGCTQDSDCMDASMPNTPFCVDGACVGCGEAQPSTCAQVYPEVPVCNANTGACVECLAGGDVSACGGTTPVCDEETNTCVECKWHEECPDTACRMSTGECFPGPVIEATDATKLNEALNQVEAIGVIHLKASDAKGSLTVQAGTVVAIIGDGQSMSRWQGDNNSPALTVEPGAEIYVQDVRIAGTQGAMEGWGIVAGGKLWLDRSAVVNNQAGGVQIVSDDAIIRNSFMGGNVPDVAAISVQGGQLTLAFSTLIAGPKSFADPAALTCAPLTTVAVRNSIFAAIADTPEVTCGTASIDSSVLEDVSMFPNNNTPITFDPVTWPGMTPFAEGDFHLSGNHPGEIETAASWQPGDPLVDIDGDPRPQDTSPTAAGADLP